MSLIVVVELSPPYAEVTLVMTDSITERLE